MSVWVIEVRHLRLGLQRLHCLMEEAIFSLNGCSLDVVLLRG